MLVATPPLGASAPQSTSAAPESSSATTMRFAMNFTQRPGYRVSDYCVPDTASTAYLPAILATFQTGTLHLGRFIRDALLGPALSRRTSAPPSLHAPDGASR